MSSNRGELQATIQQGFLKGLSAYELDVKNGYKGTLEQWLAEIHGAARVSSLDDTALATGCVIEAVGRPVFLEDVTDYSAYGLTESGWYVFARITTKAGGTVSTDTTIVGAAGYIVTPGEDYIDVAIRFEVAAASKVVTVTWAEGDTETFVFKATDLAVGNLDYGITFYMYDADKYTTWEYALTADTTFATGKNYYTKDEDGRYSLAEVTAGETVPADTYYTHSKVVFTGMTRNVTYKLDTIVDCPMEFILPVVEDDCYGCWFEIRIQAAGQYSMTLTPLDPEAKIATEHTQKEDKGINRINLIYSAVGDTKLWSFLNTRSTIPA